MPNNRVDKAVQLTITIDMTGPSAVTQKRTTQITEGAAEAIARVLDDAEIVYKSVHVEAFAMYGPWWETEAHRVRPKRMIKKAAGA